MTGASKARIAVIGAGISGMAAAWRLSKTHHVTLIEQANRLGGHANTVSADIQGETVDVDTGFIVFNPRNYPNFTPMMAHLGVETAPSDMSFSASIDDGNFEYSSNPAGLFAQKRNVLRPRMWRMLSDLLRLHERSRDPASREDPRTLDTYLREEGFSETFRDDHILPMCAAIWSSPVSTMRHYPARTFFNFFTNHGLLQLTDRPAWRTVAGGSHRYVDKLMADFDGEVRLNARLEEIKRHEHGVELRHANGVSEMFDEVVLACHSDQALHLLADADPGERSLLGAIEYRPNTAILHTDTALMPRRRKAWASWSYLEARATAEADSQISLTYWMNALQPLPTKTPVLVTLNPKIEPDPSKVLRVDEYDHPVFNEAAVRAQARLPEIQGVRRTWYCGAWMGSGFHEDGLQAGLAVAEALGAPVRPWGLEGATERVVWPSHITHRDRLVSTEQAAAE